MLSTVQGLHAVATQARADVIASAVSYVQAQMDQDRKSTALKVLQVLAILSCTWHCKSSSHRVLPDCRLTSPWCFQRRLDAPEQQALVLGPELLSHAGTLILSECWGAGPHMADRLQFWGAALRTVSRCSAGIAVVGSCRQTQLHLL